MATTDRATTCRTCGVEVPDEARFCSSCGSEVATRGEERRVATVLFADIVGFTRLSEEMDPETVKHLVDECFERLTDEITSFGGTIDKFIGDAIVALFGAPIAHEDDPERAVRAGLAMQESMRRQAATMSTGVALRVGINTGEVVVGSVAGGGYTAMGDVVNTANRLQSAAPPGGVLVGSLTESSTRSVIQYEPLGPVAVRGRAEPVEAWHAIGTTAPPGYRRRRQTGLVGRVSEMGMLHRAHEASVTRRKAHLALLMGEAGVGKTRVAEELANQARIDHDAVVLEGRCAPYGEANVWWPIAEAVRNSLDLSADANHETARKALSVAFADWMGDRPQVELDRIESGLLHLLGWSVATRDIDPVRALEESKQAALNFLEALASQRPVVLILSDLHWADVAVLELVDEVMDRLVRFPVFFVATARHELHERWSPRVGRHNQLVINLEPLSPEETEELFCRLADFDVDDEMKAILLDRSGGNPFFLEELIALFDEGGVPPITGDADHHDVSDLPNTLRGLVAARLDSLAPAERMLLEDASVWGRSGTRDVLALMWKRGDLDDVDTVLTSLVDKEILELDGKRWYFRSDLLREVAYGTLTKTDRAIAHHAIGWWLERHHGSPNDADDLTVDIAAHHFGHAASIVEEIGPVVAMQDGVRPRALAWIEEAARRAAFAQNRAVAVQLFTQALALVDDDVQRVDLLLGRAMVYAEARQLTEAGSDVNAAELTSTDLQYAAGLARCDFVRGEIAQKHGDLDGAVVSLEQAAAAFDELGDKAGEAETLRSVGMTQILRGDHEAAETAIGDALALSRETGDPRGEAWALQQRAWISFVQGKTHEAEERLESAEQLFHTINDPGGLAWVRGLQAYTHYQLGRLERASELADLVLSDTRTYGDKWGQGMMLNLAASVRMWLGQTAEALPYAEDATELFQSVGDAFGEVQSLMVSGRVLVMMGRIHEGFALLDSGFEVAGVAEGTVLHQMCRATGASTAVQVGNVERASKLLGGEVGQADHTDFIGDLDRTIAAGILGVQTDRAPEALAMLEEAHAGSAEPSAYALSAIALARAAVGDLDGARRAAQEIGEMERTTYLDRCTAGMAVGVGLARRGQVDEALRVLDGVVAQADDTGDRVARAVARLALAQALEFLEMPNASAAREDAEQAVDVVGIHASGWRRAFATILDAPQE